MSIAQSLLTIDEAADKLRMSDKQLRAHVRAGNIATALLRQILIFNDGHVSPSKLQAF